MLPNGSKAEARPDGKGGYLVTLPHGVLTLAKDTLTTPRVAAQKSRNDRCLRESVGGYLKANHAPPISERLTLIATRFRMEIAPFMPTCPPKRAAPALKPSAAPPEPAKGRAAFPLPPADR